MRIAIVNDLMPESLCRIILNVPGYDVAWIAHDGAEAIKKCASDRPDLILVDPNIPGIDGVEVTRRIMEETPCPILIITPKVEDNAAKVFKAIGYGALDVVNTPLPGNNEQAQHSREVFLKKISTIIKLQGGLSKTESFRTKTKSFQSIISDQVPPLVIIGSSTGGPKTLVKVLSHLPENLEAAIVIVQHLDEEFSSGLADWLDVQTPLRVRVATRGAHPEKGIIDVARTNDHLILTTGLRFAYTPEPHDNPFRPSVDVFFKSVAKHWPDKGCAVLLTGMGRDGAIGLAKLRKLGWHTIAQDQATSVVYGMPKAAKELNAAIEILPIEGISPAILNFVARMKNKKKTGK